jgi:hypothetical protein
VQMRRRVSFRQACDEAVAAEGGLAVGHSPEGLDKSAGVL